MLCVIKPVFCLLLAIQLNGSAQTPFPRPQKHNQSLASTDTSSIQFSKGIKIEKDRFAFEKATVPELMYLLTYYYHVPVVYQGKISKDVFSGGINRKTPLTNILEIFRRNYVPVRYDGKKVTVGE